MKLFKLALIFLLGILLLFILAASAFFMSPGLQRSLVLRALQGQVDDAGLESVQLGFSHLHMQGLSFNRDGYGIRIGTVELDYALRPLLLSRKLVIHDLAVDELAIEVLTTPVHVPPVTRLPDASSGQDISSPPPPARAPVPPRRPDPVHTPPTRVFSGLLSQIDLPESIHIHTFSAAGTYEDPATARMLIFSVQGEHLGSAWAGTLKVSASAREGDETELTLTAHADWSPRAGGGLQTLNVHALVRADKAPGLLSPQSLQGTMTAEYTPEGMEHFTAELTAEGAAQPLMSATLQFTPDLSAWQTQGMLAVEDSDLAPFALGWNLPDFKARGSWSAGLAAGQTQGEAEADFHAKVSGWDKLNAVWHGLKPVEITFQAAGSSPTTDRFTLATVTAAAAMEGENPFIDVELSSPITLQIADGHLSLSPSFHTRSFASIQLRHLPLDIIQVFLPGWHAQATHASASWNLYADENMHVRMEPVRALSMTGFSLNKDGASWLKDVDAEAAIDLSYHDEGMVASLTGVKLASGGHDLLSGSMEYVMAKGHHNAHYTWQVDVAGWFQQPLLQEFRDARSADLKLAGTMAINTDIQFAAEVDLIRWYALHSTHGIDHARISLSGTRDAEGRTTWQAPVDMRGSKGHSVFHAGGTLNTAQDDSQVFDFSIQGQRLFADDLLSLLAVIGKSDPAPDPIPHSPAPQRPRPPATTSTPPAPADASPAVAPPRAYPVWQGYTGGGTLQLEHLIYGDYTLDDVSAQVAVTPDQITLDPVKARFHNAPLTLNANLIFDPHADTRQRYQLKGHTQLEQFDAGAYLSRNRRGPKPFEGRFTFNGAFHAQAAEPAMLGERIQGDFRLQGGPGKLRLLAAAGGETAQAGAQLAGGLIGVASIFGGSVVKELPALGKLMNLLQEIDYTELNFHALRDASLNVDIRQLLLQAPELRLQGAGTIRYREGIGFSNLPMAISTELDARGQAADLMKQLRLLQVAEPTADGYLRGPRFNITGTPAGPDFSELTNIVLRAGRAMAQGLIGDPLGLGSPSEDGDAPATTAPVREAERAVRDLFQRFVAPPPEPAGE